MAKSQKSDNNLGLVEFGKRIAIVRKNIFKLRQVEFAPLIGTTQGILSRLELGIGGNLHIVFELVNFINKSGFKGHLLLKGTFDINLMTAKKRFISRNRSY